MSSPIITLTPDSIWSVIFKDEGQWRIGLYKPEHKNPIEIEILERHTCPELFVCLGGRMGIVIGYGKEEHAVEMQPQQALLVDDYHNGYAIDPQGYFLVVERTSFTTEYIDRKTGNFMKKVEVQEGIAS